MRREKQRKSDRLKQLLQDANRELRKKRSVTVVYLTLCLAVISTETLKMYFCVF